MKRFNLALMAGLAAALIVSVRVGQAGDPGQTHYPDLRTREPADLQIRMEAGKKMLRFSNTVYNFGRGPLEVQPKHKPRGATDAYQRLYSHDANGAPYQVEERFVGTFVFHRAHHHWHFEGFALYELRDDASGSIGSVLRASQKNTVCIRDNSAPESGGSSLEHFGWGGYSRCDKNATEGLSVGYGDTYPWDIAGQNIDISGLTDGCYWLRSEANPPDGSGSRKLKESNYDNNANAKQFRISGTSISNCA
jgi:Lysyl oxidase